MLIPDIPRDVKVQIQREKLLAREILFEKTEEETTRENQGLDMMRMQRTRTTSTTSTTVPLEPMSLEEEVDQEEEELY